jgi:hypothetical protein
MNRLKITPEKPISEVSTETVIDTPQEQKPKRKRVNKKASSSGVLPNDFRSNGQRMKMYHKKCSEKHPDCIKKVLDGNYKEYHECCSDCKSFIRRRIPTNKRGIPIYELK